MGTIPKPRPDAGRGKILSTALLALALLASLVTFSPLAEADNSGGGNGGGYEQSTYPGYICHAKPKHDAKNGWNKNPVDEEGIFTQGHHGHAADIIPAFSYTKNHQTKTYPGKNLDRDFDGVTGQQILDNGCVKPAKSKVTLPQAPATSGPTCNAPESVALPNNGNGISYSATGNLTGPGSVTIEARLSGYAEWSSTNQNVNGWTRNGKMNSGYYYSKSYDLAGKLPANDPLCQSLVVPNEPTVTPDGDQLACEVTQQVILPTGPEGVSYSQTGPVNGVITVTASLTSDTFKWGQVDSGWTLNTSNNTYSKDVPVATGAPCATEVTPRLPTVTPKASKLSCEQTQTVVLPTGPKGVQYTKSEPVNGVVTVTATLKPGNYAWGSVGNSWTWNDGSNSYSTTIEVKTGPDCPEEVAPVAIEVQSATCEAPALVTVPTSGAVAYTYSSNLEGPGFVWVEARLTNGHVWESNSFAGWTRKTEGHGMNKQVYFRWTARLGDQLDCYDTIFPVKNWAWFDADGHPIDVDDLEVPGDGGAAITLSAGEGASGTWTFAPGESSGVGPGVIRVPVDADVSVSEEWTNPEGWTCEFVSSEDKPAPVPMFGDFNRGPESARMVVVTNNCSEIPEPEVPVIPTPGEPEVGGIEEEPTTTTTEAPTTTTETPTTPEPEVLDTVVTPTTVAKQTLPKTGSNTSTVLSLAGVLMTAGAALVLFGRRRFNTGS